ncbi:Diacylglycerol kinase [Novipirellula aureliae]|uniref:Diacylglycerol kinase n=1 Tax=Novipirellula aureliae TaxID=2527966 RepID=A0A5C6E6W8_9BACT|nr:diacylglycerol kinase family protein [Novipirellula aureliae]TWU43216.1 Diacylglycerol kinase [Novipirellula aureliae]
MPEKNDQSQSQPLPAPSRIVVLTSPKAGSGRHRESLPQLHERLFQANYQVFITDSTLEFRERIRSSNANSNHPSTIAVAAGGDGTVRLAADLTPPSVPMVVMPFGTENLLARNYGYSPHANDTFHTIVHGVDHQMDAGRANGRLFLVMASCGFDAEVVRDVHLRRRGHIHRLSYARPIYRAIRKYSFPKLMITSDEGPDRQVHWAMAFNLPCYAAGLKIEPDAIDNDGKLDLISFAGGSIASGLRYVAGVITGRHLQYADVTRERLTRITITSDHRVPYQLDGDYVGRLPLTIETEPGRLKLRLPV